MEKAFLVVFMTVFLAAGAHAAPGDLDTTFYGNGIEITAIGSGHDSGYSVIQQRADDKLVVAGSSNNGSDYDFAVVRYNSKGVLDATFDGDGRLTTAIGPGDDVGTSVIQQTDGKLVIAGYSYNGSNYDFALVRYNSDGSLDTTFSGDGKLTTAIGSGDDFGAEVIQQVDGKLVVAGSSHNGSDDDFALVRYNSDGSLDTTFSGDGKLTTAIGSGYDSGGSVIQQADGKLVVAGRSYSGINYNYDFALVRYNSEGSLDTTFSGDGRLTTAIGSGDDLGASIIQQSDGKLVVAGSSSINYNDDFALVRYNSDGSLDATFSGDGKLTTAVGSASDVGMSVIQQADGKLVVAGYSNNNINNDFALVRYSSDGSLDTTFSGDGKQATAVGSAGDIGYSVIQQADGNLVVAGYSNNGSDNDFALVRYTTDTLAPTVPSGVSATVVSASQINLSWAAATDVLGVTAYKIYRGGTLLTTLGNVTSYSSTGLTPSTSYSYTVAACDAAGNCSAQSSAATATTLADAIAPTVPTGLSAMAVSPTQISLSWSASTDASGVAAYKIYRGGTWLTTLGNVTNYSNTGLTPSTSYSYTVAACDAAGNCSAQSSAAAATTLADLMAPTVPVLSTPSRMYVCSPGCYAQLSLYWTASTDNIGVTAYKIYRDGVLLTTLGNVTGYQDTFLPLSTTYSYTVAACDAAGNCSAQSSVVIATTPNPSDTTAPTVPGGLSATAVSPTQINLNWAASIDAVGVTMYKIYRGDGTLLTILGNVTNYSNTGLMPSTSYSYIVSACDAAGNCSPLTYSATATTLADAIAPTVPGGLSAAAASATQINLTWSASADATGVTAYKIYRDGTLLTTLGNVTSFSSAGLSPSTTYSYTVAACDVAGNCSAQSSAATATTPADTTAPTVPGGFSATATSATQINLSWIASSDAVGVTAYKIYRGGTLLTTLGIVTSYSDTGLTASTLYSYKVAACDAAGNCSAQSAAASATTLDITAPTIPSGMSATAVNTTQINLSWAASTDAIGVAAYRVYRGGRLLVTLGNVTSYSDSGLIPSTTYSYTVAACDAAGNCSARSSTATATTFTPPDTIAPTVPSELSATAVSTTQIDLNWTASTDAIGVTAYKIYRSGSFLATLGNVTSYSNMGLTPSTSYSYTVAACDAAGNCSAQSFAAMATTLDPDSDGDGITDSFDNCVLTNNASQTNNDGDSQGDACDADDDNDGVADTSDNCPLSANTNQLDWDSDGFGDKCDDPVPMPADLAGAVAKDAAGKAVAYAGDFNSDGYGDYVIGIPGFDAPGAKPIKDAGRAIVISGKDGSSLASTNGTVAKDALGTAVAGGDDINNDGFDDVVVGAPNAGVTHAGSVTVLYGPSGSGPQTISGTVAKSAFGSAVALGDVNGDSRADILVGAPKDDAVAQGLADAGSVTVHSGNGLNVLGTPLYGATAKANAGASVASGDLNSDGNADIIIGAPGDGGVGSVKAYTLSGTLLLQNFNETTKSQFGRSVASGDVTGDGYDDVLVGAPADDDITNARKDAGSITVFSGNDGGLLLKKYGAIAKANLGNSVAAGDVNGDGKADIIAGAWKDDKTAVPKAIKDTGSLSVWSGDDYAPIATLYGDLSKDYFGAAVSTGDINSDGKDDLIIGISGFDAPATKPKKNAGAVRVMSGAEL